MRDIIGVDAFYNWAHEISDVQQVFDEWRKHISIISQCGIGGVFSELISLGFLPIHYEAMYIHNDNQRSREFIGILVPKEYLYDLIEYCSDDDTYQNIFTSAEWEYSTRQIEMKNSGKPPPDCFDMKMRGPPVHITRNSSENYHHYSYKYYPLESICKLGQSANAMLDKYIYWQSFSRNLQQNFVVHFVRGFARRAKQRNQ